MHRLYLVRHGETDWNAAKRYLGWSDIALNAKGYKQAQQLVKDLSDVSFNSCYCSDLSRAQETAAQILRGSNLKPIITTDLRELNFGDWEGLTFQEISDLDQVAINAWYDSGGMVAPPAGEALSELESRLRRWLKDLFTTNIQGNILVVSHAGALRLLLCILLEIPVLEHWQFSFQPGELKLVEISDGKDAHLVHN